MALLSVVLPFACIFLQKLQAADFNVNELFDYTDDVQSIIDRVEASPPSQASQCCAYQHQLLDQYCASQTPVIRRRVCLE